MRLQDIHIRDPFILSEDGTYYLYGSRGSETWDKCTGLDVYTSTDLSEWSNPIEAFTRPADFWSDMNFWAPEVHKYKGSYYMFVSFKSMDRCRGTQILKSSSPMGPFLVHSDGPVTPVNWECLDGTLHIEADGTPYMVFCHEWVQVKDGEMCAIRLTDDLKAPAGQPFLLFRASQPEWARKNAPDYVTDGPFMHRSKDGGLLMFWSSFCDEGYCVAISRSDNGRLDGKWTHDTVPLISGDGGHGMLFRTKEGSEHFIFHRPNKSPQERPHIVNVDEDGGVFQVLE